ncbi:hypothetical protein NDU88_008536 [Pleurodeles waltl]|uniref:Uncharacterized protein n=1 Tax=Pleurodeles waltl TaxID=8319 RepID=A0AAV7NEJ9_PLEWA|nr:hypothetical protein NDU88_008536 [Pleurodeles waltl]
MLRPHPRWAGGRKLGCRLLNEEIHVDDLCPFNQDPAVKEGVWPEIGKGSSVRVVPAEEEISEEDVGRGEMYQRTMSAGGFSNCLKSKQGALYQTASDAEKGANANHQPNGEETRRWSAIASHASGGVCLSQVHCRDGSLGRWK